VHLSFPRFHLICLLTVLTGSVTGCGGPGRNTSVSEVLEVLYVADSSAGNIQAYRIDNATGTLTALPGSPFPGGGGTGVAVDASGKFLFVGSPDGQIVDVYSISPGTGALAKLTDPNSDSRQPGQTGAGGRYGLLGTFAGSFAVIPSRQLLYVTNTNEGGVYAFSIGSSGELTPLTGSPFNVPLTNPLGLAADPSGKFLYTGNIWDGSILESTIDPMSGALTAATGSPFDAGTCCTLTVDQSGGFLYRSVIGNSIYAFAVSPDTGALTPVDGSPFLLGRADHFAGDPRGRFLYGSFTGYGDGTELPDVNGTISATAINESTGALTSIPGSPFRVEMGANFVAIDPTGKFLYVSNLGVRGQNHGSLSAYAIDPTTGTLAPIPGFPISAGQSPQALAIVQLQ